MSDLNGSKSQMAKTVDFLLAEFSRMRVGRASVSMVDEVKVEVYGSTMTIKEVAALSLPDSRTIAIQPWDLSVVSDIERGILASNLGLTPMNDGRVIRLIMPPMTEERRKEFVKQIKKQGEDAKVTIRGTRREAIDDAKKNEFTKDEMRRLEDDVQKMTNGFTKKVDDIVETKSQEVLSV